MNYNNLTVSNMPDTAEAVTMVHNIWFQI